VRSAQQGKSVLDCGGERGGGLHWSEVEEQIEFGSLNKHVVDERKSFLGKPLLQKINRVEKPGRVGR